MFFLSMKKLMSLRKIIYSIIPTNRSRSCVKTDSIYRDDSLAIIIHTCDDYTFCWAGWHHYFKKYWNLKLPFSIYFVNEDIDVDFDGISQIKTGIGEWSTRLKKALGQIPEQNIVYLQEDVWLQAPIDIEKYYSIFLSLSLDRFQLSPTDSTYTLFSKFSVGDLILRKFARKSNYLISHQPSIWKKSFLIGCLDQSESPWENEIEGTKRLRKNSQSFSIYLSIIDWYTAVSRQGELTRDGLDLEKKVPKSSNSYSFQ